MLRDDLGVSLKLRFSPRQSHSRSLQLLRLQCFQPDALWQQRQPLQQLSQCVYSGSISGSVFMLSIIQLAAPSWAALADGEPAHWSYTVGGRVEEGLSGKKGVRVKSKKDEETMEDRIR